MGREATGCAQWSKSKNAWLAWLTLTDKSRKPVEMTGLAPHEPECQCTPKAPCDVRRAAIVQAALLARRARKPGASWVAGGRTVSEYADVWLKARTGRVRSVSDNKGHLECHILPLLASFEMTSVTTKLVEDVVAALDAKVTKGELSAKTARNIWGTCTKLFDDATNAKHATGLRCIERDPTTGVRGPDDNDSGKILQFLYPSEVSAFLACAAVPLAWRRNAAIAIYLCLRDGEQRALKWHSVDLVHGVVTVSETYDRREQAAREGTKSGAARVVPIRPELMPLLEAMHVESGGEGLVCELPSFRDMARGLRRWLWNADVRRVQLHEGSTVSKQLRWHDLRATGLTWLAVEGVSATEIRDVAGHTATSMTDRYMRAAGMLRGDRFGRPFPTLPGVLSGNRVANRVFTIGSLPSARNHNDNERGGRDSNPRPPA